MPSQHLAVQLGQGRLQAGDRLGGELLGQRGVAVDEQAGPQAADEGEGLQEPLGGAFGGEWLPQVGHEHVAGEQHAAGREVDHQRVCGFPARRRVQDELGAPCGQRRRLADQLVGDDGRGAFPAAPVK